VVADDNPDALRQMVTLLRSEFDVVATADNGQAALDCVRRHQPEVVVLDLKMPILNGIEASRELSKLIPHPAIVICSVENDPEIIGEALQAGALSYVVKMRMVHDLVIAVRLAASGESFISSS
jgi:DNA-binding NarL/FixJ family response regulator